VPIRETHPFFRVATHEACALHSVANGSRLTMQVFQVGVPPNPPVNTDAPDMSPRTKVGGARAGYRER